MNKEFTSIWKGSGHAQSKVLSWHLPERIMGNHEIPIRIAGLQVKI
jgi:hypothetical protein